MRQLFLCILSLSLSGALTGLVLLFIRPLTGKFFSKKWNYYIWLLVIARLLLPVHFETTGWQYGVLSRPGNGEWTDEAEGGIGTASADIAESEKEREAYQTQEPLDGSKIPALPAPVSSTETAAGLKSWQSLELPEPAILLASLWLVGACLFLLAKLAGYWRFAGCIRKNSREVTDDRLLLQMKDLCRRLSVKKAPALWESSDLAGPITIGLLRPAILLPADVFTEKLMDENEPGRLVMVLHHELIHVKRKDLWYKWLYQLLLCIHWFNLVLHLIGRKLNRDCELSCDEAVLGILTQDGKRAYGNLLISAAERNLYRNKNIFSTTFLERKEDLRERLKGILQYKKRGGGRRAASLCAAFGMLVLSACGSVQMGQDAMPIQVSGKTGDEGEDRESLTWVSFWGSVVDRLFDYDVDDFLRNRMIVNKNGKAWKVYDDDELLAGKDVGGQQSAFIYSGGSSGVSCSGLLLNGSESILIQNVEEEMELQVDSSFELVEGRFKIVYVSPQGQVSVLNETGEASSGTVALKKGRNVIKMVGQGSKLKGLEIRFLQPEKEDAEGIYYSEIEEYADRVLEEIKKGQVDKEELFDALAYMEADSVSQVLRLLLEQEIPLNTDEICDLLIYSDAEQSGRYLADAVRSGKYRLSDRNALSEFFPYLADEEKGELLAAVMGDDEIFSFQMLEEYLPLLGDADREQCVLHYLDQGNTLTYSQFAEISPYLSQSTIEKIDGRMK